MMGGCQGVWLFVHHGKPKLLLISSAMRTRGGRRWFVCYLCVLVVRAMMFWCCGYFLCFNLCLCKVFTPGFPYKLGLFSSS
jgi:hypothetical protein